MNAPVLKKETIQTSNIQNHKAGQVLKFREVSEQIASLAQSVGIRVIPYFDPELPHFTKLNSDQRERVLKSLEVYLKVYNAVKAEGSSLLDSARVIWNALAQLGLRPTADLFSFIQSGNVIEIHGNDSVQMFRNLVFFNFCSYTLEELYSFTMPQLYSRDRAIEAGILTTAEQIFTGKINHVVKLAPEPHIISESFSCEKLQIKDQINYFAPLYSSTDNSIALLSIENAQIVSIEIKPIDAPTPEFSL